MPFRKVAIIGLGLIGGSLARALKHSKQVEIVYGVDTDKGSIEHALENDMVDEGSVNVDQAVSGAEIVVIATHVGAITETVKSLIPYASEGAVITDVGSVKGKIVKEIEQILPPHLHFVGGHPIAGTENSGVRASNPELFRGKRFIMTPTANTDGDAKIKVAALWKTAGSEVHEMDTETHDRIFGFVSHLPHIVAYSLIDAVLSADDSDMLFDFAGGGLGDYTRVAASSPEMWVDIFSANKKNVLQAIRQFKDSIEKIETLIESEDSETLRELLSKASDVKRSGLK